MEQLLEVAVRHDRDVLGAVEGGADRLLLAVEGRSPDVPTAAAVLRAAARAEVPVRVALRLDETHTTTGGGLMRLIGLGEEYLSLGAEGLVFGFLDADLEIDVDTTLTLSRALPGVPWTFPEAVDLTLDLGRSWSRLVRMPCLTTVRTAGSPQGVEVGVDPLLEALASSSDVPRFVMPGRGLRPEHVPWLARAGVWQWHLDEQARPGGSDLAYVDADHVRSWRLLVDDVAGSLERAEHAAQGVRPTA